MHWLSAAAPIVCFLLIFVDTKRATDLKNDDDWKPCQKTGTCGDSDNNDDDDDDDDNNRDVNYDEELEKNVQKKQWNVTTQGCSNCGESTPSGGCGGTNENDEIISPEVIDNYGSGTDSETPSGDVDCDCKHDGCKGSDVAEDEDGMDCGMSCHSCFHSSCCGVSNKRAVGGNEETTCGKNCCNGGIGGCGEDSDVKSGCDSADGNCAANSVDSESFKIERDCPPPPPCPAPPPCPTPTPCPSPPPCPKAEASKKGSPKRNPSTLNQSAMLPPVSPFGVLLPPDQDLLLQNPVNYGKPIAQMSPSASQVVSTSKLQELPETNSKTLLDEIHDCCTGCNASMCRTKKPRLFSSKSLPSDNERGSKCSSEALKEVMIMSMKRDPARAKRAIQRAAEEKFHAKFHVICSRGDFNYITHSRAFCEISARGNICYAFRE